MPRVDEQQAVGEEERVPCQAELLSPERAQRARAVHRAYYRWLRISRLVLAAFITLAAAFLFWTLPWIPSGLDTSDYTPELTFTVYLAVGLSVIGVCALVAQELARRYRESLMVWSAVYDEATGLHSRTYLYDRLSLECERAKRGGAPFSVIVLLIRAGSSGWKSMPRLPEHAIEQVANVIDRLTHPADAVALLSGTELAVLAIGARPEGRGALVERLRAAVTTALARFLDEGVVVDVIAGAATYGVEGTEPGGLVQAARSAAAFTLPDRRRSA